MSEQVKETNLTTLAHAVELASKVIQKVAGEAIATTVNGEHMTSLDLKNAVTAKMQSCFPINEGVKE